MVFLRRSRFYAIASFVLLLLFLASCAPRKGNETTIRQAQQLSASAVAYSDALTNLVETTIDLLIRDNNNQLLKQYDLLKGETDEKTRTQMLTSFLTDQNEAILKQIDAMRDYEVQLKFIKAYFQNLQALANASAGEDTSKAVAQLASNIDSFNNQLKDQSAGSTVSSGEGSALGGLAGLVVENIRARKLEEALKRDADTIDLYFKNQDKMLDILAGILKSSSDQVLDKKRQEVQQAYVSVSITSTSAWSQQRKEVLLASFSNAAVDSARKASEELRNVWRNILQGQDDIGSIDAFLTNLNTFVIEANNFKTAQKERKASRNERNPQ